MNGKRRTQADFKTTRWAGGSTCELYLYPETGSYERRDFLFRLSSASIEQDGAPFTPLPGVMRHLLLLEGALQLQKAGEAPRTLLPFSPVTFSGGEPVRSFGKGRDFNLMVKGGAKGQLSCRFLSENGAAFFKTPAFGTGTYWKTVYAAAGAVIVQGGDAPPMRLEQGQLAVLSGHAPFAAEAACRTPEGARLVCADVFVPDAASAALRRGSSRNL